MRTVLNAAGDALARSGAADLGALVLEQVEARRSSGCGSRFLAEHIDYKEGQNLLQSVISSITFHHLRIVARTGAADRAQLCWSRCRPAAALCAAPPA